MRRVNTPTGQFYHVHLLNKVPYRRLRREAGRGLACAVRCAGRRRSVDAAAAVAVARWRAGGAAPSPYSEFYGVAGGESGYMASDPIDPNVTFGGNYSGVIDMQNRATGERASARSVAAQPDGPRREGFEVSLPVDLPDHELAARSERAVRRIERRVQVDGQGQELADHLARSHQARSRARSARRAVRSRKDQTSIEYYATVFALQESPITPGLIWAGSDDGLIHVTRDGGKTWKNVTPKGLPRVDAHLDHRSVAARRRARRGSRRIAISSTTTRRISTRRPTTARRGRGSTTAFPVGEYTRSIREDLVKPGLLYAATERSMWMSRDAGAHWESLKKNLPPVPVHDIALRDDDMVIATHGRAFWVMENLALLRAGARGDGRGAAGKDFRLHAGAGVSRRRA